MAALLRDGDERRRLGTAARTQARARFDVAALAPRYEALYATLVGTS
jgi:hypothetical protein